MLRTFLHAKLHQARVTRCDPEYNGSIAIDADLLAATGLRPNEQVHVFDIDNAARFQTYVLLAEAGSGAIEVNGAAAHLVEEGHRLIVLGFGLLDNDPAALDAHVATVVVCDEHNRVAKTIQRPSTLDLEASLAAD